MTIKKALIATAGFGTRFLPITKTIQKEMLPILNHPTIDYVVTDCIRAGITEIIFVVNEHNAQIQDYYTGSAHIKNRLQSAGKTDEYAEIEKLHTQANYTFVKQRHGEEYGSGVPVKLAREYLESEDAFLVFMGDDFVFNSDKSSETKRMIKLFQANSGATGLISCVERPDDTLHRYGVIQTKTNGNHLLLQDIIEKPVPGTAPSNLANISKYIFTPNVFPLLESQALDQRSNELLITDTLLELAKTSEVVVHKPKGEFLDSGTVGSWLQANIRMAYKDPVLRQQVLETIETLQKTERK